MSVNSKVHRFGGAELVDDLGSAMQTCQDCGYRCRVGTLNVPGMCPQRMMIPAVVGNWANAMVDELTVVARGTNRYW